MIRAFLLAALLFLTATPAWAVVSTDAVSNDLIANSGATTYDFAGPAVVSGSNGYVLVYIMADVNDTTIASSMTYDPAGANTAMTRLGNVATAAPLSVEVWGVPNAATGSKTIALAGLSSAGTVDYVLCGSSFTGVHQTTPTGTVVTGSGVISPATVTVTTAANGLNYIGTGVYVQTPTVGSGITQDCSRGSATVKGRAGYSTQDTNDWTFTNASWGIVGVPLQPAAAATTIRRRAIQY